MRFRVLGPVEVHADDGRVSTPARRRERCLLAVLLLEAGHVVPARRLMDLLWEDEAPEPARRRALYGHVARIRAVLAAAGAAEHAIALVSHGNGYLMRVDPQAVDVHRFRGLVERAATTTDLPARERILREALSLWHGPPLHNAANDRLRERICADLAESRLHAAEEYLATGLALGRHTELAAELARLSAEHPLRGRLTRLHMLALYHSGRTADALQVYSVARRKLADELGLDPEPAARDLQRAMLRGQPLPTSDLPTPKPPTPDPARGGAVRPAQLPHDVVGFTGRESCLKLLDELVEADYAAGRPDAVVISAIAGTAGVGKTALALRWAHRVADRFPDGQLYVDLRGYDPDQPLAPGDVLAAFLRELGVAGADVPLEPSERESRYRTLMSGRRMLVVLDNASTVELVRPLLPGTPSCLVVVTSRDSLAGLVARHGARRIELDLLPLADAVTLLRTLIGGRVDAEPEAAATLVGQCARLPLALRLAAELAAARPDTPLADLVDELADQRHRLELFDAGGDPRSSVRAVFSWSYRHLPAGAGRAFRLLGLHPGADFDAYAAAALTNTTGQEARRLLDALARAHLIHPAGAGRYGMHDLLRAYAAKLATEHDPDDDRLAALTRLFDQYLATAAAAMDTLHPAERHRRPRIPPVDTPGPPVATTAAALAWLDAERPNLVAACAHTAAHGWPDYTIRLAAVLFRYLDTGSHYPDALIIHTHARNAARDTGDRVAEGHALIHLGAVHSQQGRHRLAVEHFEHALTLTREAGDRAGEARALSNLAVAQYQQGEYPQAARHAQRARTLFREIGDRFGEARTLDYLGDIHKWSGRYEEAASDYREGIAIFRELGDRVGEAIAMDNLAEVYQRQGRYPQAADHHRRALTIFRENGERAGEAYALTGLGEVYLRQGCHAQAADHHRLALAIFHEIGHRGGEAKTLNGLGEAVGASGQPEEARAHYTTALAVAADTGDRAEEAHAHDGLAHTYHATREPEQAHQHWQQALAIYADLASPETDRVRACLATLDAGA